MAEQTGPPNKANEAGLVGGPRVGRPSIAAERREQILDALEAAVAENGLAEVTLQQVADRAGITRSAIGHFIGSRDDLIDAAAARSVERIRAQVDAAIDSAPPSDRLETFIDVVFSRGPMERETVLDLNDELVALAHRDSHARAQLTDLYSRFEEMIEDLLVDRFPQASDEAIASIALGSILLLREADRVSNLGLTSQPELVRRRATRAVRVLFDSLSGS